MTQFRWLTRQGAHGLLAIAAVALVAGATPVRAQEPREAALRITVSDPTGAIIVSARVTVLPTEPAGPPHEAVTDERGEA
jgi:hypothetical protein